MPTTEDIDQSCQTLQEQLDTLKVLWSNVTKQKEISSGLGEIEKSLKEYRKALAPGGKNPDKHKASLKKQTATLLKTLKTADQQVRTTGSLDAKTSADAKLASLQKKSFQIAYTASAEFARDLSVLLAQAGTAQDGGQNAKIIAAFHARRAKTLKIIDGGVDNLKIFFGFQEDELRKINSDCESTLFEPDDIAELSTTKEVAQFLNDWIKPEQASLADYKTKLQEIQAELLKISKLKNARPMVELEAGKNKNINDQLAALNLPESDTAQTKQADRETAQRINKSCAKFFELLKRLENFEKSLDETTQLWNQRHKAVTGAIALLRNQQAKIKSGAIPGDDEKMASMERQLEQDRKNAGAQLKKVRDTIAENLGQIKQDTAAVLKMAITLGEHTAAVVVETGAIDEAAIRKARNDPRDPGDALDELVEALAARRKRLEKAQRNALQCKESATLMGFRNDKCMHDNITLTALISRDLTAAREAIPTLNKIKALIDPVVNKYHQAVKSYNESAATLRDAMAAEDKDIKKTKDRLDKTIKEYEKAAKKK